MADPSEMWLTCQIMIFPVLVRTATKVFYVALHMEQNHLLPVHLLFSIPALPRLQTIQTTSGSLLSIVSIDVYTMISSEYISLFIQNTGWWHLMRFYSSRYRLSDVPNCNKSFIYKLFNSLI